MRKPGNDGWRTDETVESRIGWRERRVRGDIFPPQVSGVYDQSQVRRLVGLEFAKNTLIAEAER